MLLVVFAAPGAVGMASWEWQLLVDWALGFGWEFGLCLLIALLAPAPPAKRRTSHHVAAAAAQAPTFSYL